ncbi:MAG: 30S ribosomal protein S16 [Patescibacteria group bacterium]
MLMIRLTRFGRKNAPTFRLTVAEKTKDALGDVLEFVGTWNRRANPKIVNLETERIKYWLSKGAQPSASVHNLLVSQGVITGAKVHAFRLKKKEAAKGAEEKPAAAAEEKSAEEKPAENEPKV